jgi:hypothetical protein
MDVKEQRLRSMPHRGQIEHAHTRISQMTMTQSHIAITQSATSRACPARLVSLFRHVFKRPDDMSQYLSLHLRRDAGIDELDLERKQIARAPLIK